MTRAAWLAFALVACGARTGLRAGNTTVDASLPDAPSDLTPDFVWYRLDETSGTTAHDSSPNHYDVTNLSGVVWDDGAIFDGATCGSTIVGAAFRTPPVTITAWLAPAERHDEGANSWGLAPFPPDALSGDVPSLGGYGVGLDVWTDGGGGRALAVETGVDATVGYHSLTGPFNPNEERFVALVITTSSAAVWVDGSLLSSVTTNVPPPTQPTPLHLGCHNDDTGYGTKRFFAGRMRDARVYLRDLDASQVAELFSQGPD